ncbi:DNA-binding transcriptional regulator, GntR family [Loktanella sp. DSM 29012]|uniref:GntR family transcriptional regulator n=1 Tax=Loktanella gaetbuli TaxID=2881335 RepID=A0ABS8BXH7_9RHOB|nr:MULTISPECIES: GntR family transcriptional regulator [Loktanella]MCB5200457.1 GntR family transcriptional regulator [Loktanella gaetbuli]SEQ38351.1 DNA-binding transcriptional regulator, GntR family [Loktanella sp. DSM 29012]
MKISGTLSSGGSDITLPLLRQTPQPTVADQVFDTLQQRILKLELPPQTKISEAEVSKLMGVSRQPVREAFKRLAKLGFLHIRPQSSTTVSLISEEAVLRAQFIRTALEVKTCRTACETSTPQTLAPLHALIARQKEAIEAQDRDLFHALDEEFHIAICVLADVRFVWDLIQDSKAHMDRIRMLSLNTTSQKLALQEHVAILDAISARDPDTAEAAMTAHLSRIVVLIDEVKKQQHSFFQETDT